MSPRAQGLHDILFSKITKKQRDPAMMLVASVIEVSGTHQPLIHSHSFMHSFFSFIFIYLHFYVIIIIYYFYIDLLLFNVII